MPTVDWTILALCGGVKPMAPLNRRGSVSRSQSPAAMQHPHDENASVRNAGTSAITADARHRTSGLSVDAIRHNGLDDLSSLSFHAFAGRLHVQQLRALVIGCGESALSLAEQLQGTHSRVVFCAPNRAAMTITRGRAQQLGVMDGIEWHHGSLAEIAQMQLSGLDYISAPFALNASCDPERDLRQLRSMLGPSGVVGLCLNGRYGCAGLRQVQDLMQRINGHSASQHEKTENTQWVMSSLPRTNWYMRGRTLFADEQAELDHSETQRIIMTDDERSFSLPEVHALLDSVDLHFAEFSVDWRALYETDFAFQNPELNRRVKQLELRDQQAAAELYWGSILSHQFWATNAPPEAVDRSDTRLIPYFSRGAVECGLVESILATGDEPYVMQHAHADGVDVSLSFQVVPAVRRFVQTVDGQCSLDDIVTQIASEYQPMPERSEVIRVCRYLVDLLAKFDLLLLRDPSVPPILG